MGFRLFSNPAAPIAISFGSSSVKLLQFASSSRGESEQMGVAAAAEAHLHDAAQQSTDELFAIYECELQSMLRSGGFKGRRVVCSVPEHQTIVQHMQLPHQDGIKQDEMVKMQLQMQLGISPQSAVVRTIPVAELNRAGQNRTEVICIAIPRDVVMRYVNLFAKFKMEVVGVHTDVMATVRAFDHIHKRKGDENLTNMYVDLGYSGTRVIVTHGREIVFARSIQVGGMHFDQLIASETKCELADARAHRLAMESTSWQRPDVAAAPAGQSAAAQEQSAMAQAGGGGAEAGNGNGVTVVAGERRQRVAPAALAVSVDAGDGQSPAAGAVDFSELLDTISDELSMCLRYHRGLFPNRSVDRAILVGGEARQKWLCQHVVRSLRLPAQLGDPIARFTRSGIPANSPGVDLLQPQPGWTVACGLSAVPEHG